MKKVMTLGCAGGIGSGKSYVSRVFGMMGYPAYFSDDRAKMLYDTDPELLAQVVELLGDDILKDGKLDRKAMAGKIFADTVLLEQVEALVHPAVLRDFEKWKEAVCTQMEREGRLPGFVIFESAILLETPQVRGSADKVLHVKAPYELRIERVMKRDAATREQIEARIAQQWDDGQRDAMSDFIIFADSKQALLPQIVQVIEGMEKMIAGTEIM